MAAKNRVGIVYDSIQAGSFYHSKDPGGWTDRTTGIKVPGPIVNVSKDGSRGTESIREMPDPVQLPHFKVIIDFKDKDRKVQETKEVPFDRSDETPLHDGLNQALSAGVIFHVPDDEVEEFYPNAWALRKERYVFDEKSHTPKTMAELLADYRATQEKGGVLPIAPIHADRKAQDEGITEIAQSALEKVFLKDEPSLPFPTAATRQRSYPKAKSAA